MTPSGANRDLEYKSEQHKENVAHEWSLLIKWQFLSLVDTDAVFTAVILFDFVFMLSSSYFYNKCSNFSS